MSSSVVEVSPSPLIAGPPDPTPPRSWRDFFLGSDTPPPPPAARAEVELDRRLKPGAVLGKDWEILGPLGSGGMSDVFKAFNRRDHRRYALKVLAEKHRDSPSEVARFELEYLALTRVRHESIVVPFVAGCEGGIPYYAMELLEGESLERAFTRERLSSLDAARVGLAVAQALTTVHAAGIIHRDLKPANIFVVKGGVKLLDLGIAKLLPEFYEDIEQRLPPEARPQTGPGVYLGTHGYMAPEVVQGAQASPAQDVYGLAVTLCRVITGRFPYHSIIPPGDDDEPNLEVEAGPPMHPALEDVLRRALAVRPGHRHESMAELCAELTLAIGEMEQEGAAPVVEGASPPEVRQPAGASAVGGRSTPPPAPRRPPRGLLRSDLALRALILAGVFAALGAGILEGIRSERAAQSGLRSAARFADAVTRAAAHAPTVSPALAAEPNAEAHAVPSAADPGEAMDARTVDEVDEHVDERVDEGVDEGVDAGPTQVDPVNAVGTAAAVMTSTPRPRRQGLTRAAFDEAVAPHRAALDRCLRDIPGASVLEIEADITAGGDLEGVRLSPSTYIATRCVDRILRGLHFPTTQIRSTHRITLKQE